MPTTTPTIWAGPTTIPGLSGVRFANIAALADGGFALVCAAGPDPEPGSPVGPDLFGQYYSGAGTATGGNFLSSVAGDFFRDIDAVQLGDGSLAFAATRFDIASAQADLLLGSIAGPAGTVTTALAATSSDDETAAGVFRGADGRATALFFRESDFYSGGFDSALALSPQQGERFFKLVEEQVWTGAQLANGSTAIVTNRPLPDAQYAWELTFYDSPTTGVVKTVSLPLRFPTAQFALEPTADGRLIVCHNESDSDGLRYQVFASNGDVLVSSRFYAFAGAPSFIEVAALDDGGFLIAWTQSDGFEDVGGTNPNVVVKLQRFDAEGDIVGRPVRIDQAGDQFVSDMETLADGRVLLTFLSGSNADLAGLGQRFMIFDPRDGVIEGDETANGLYARLADSELLGFEGNDTLTGMGGDDTLLGGAGADTLAGGVGDDSARGGSGSDSILGGSGDDTMVGGGGADTLRGEVGADFMAGGGGDDVYIVDDLGDEVSERRNAGVDLVYSSLSWTLGDTFENLTLYGADAINGAGNALNNVIVGNNAGNILNGGLGRDTLLGNGGVDRFVFDTALGASNVDVIRSYVLANDVIYLDDAVFTGLSVGALRAGAFNTGSAATQADDRVIYNASTGAVLFDRDGVGGAAAVQFASVAANLAGFGAGEFYVI